MKIFKKKKTTFITVEMEGKTYDYPQDLPIPRIGEDVYIKGSSFGKVTQVCHQIIDNKFRVINIRTLPYED